MVASFLCNGVIFGVINSYSVIFERLQKQLEDAGVENATSKASSVGSLTIGVTFLLSPLAGVLVDRFGIRPTTFVGGLLAASGMFLSSLFVDSVTGLCVTYGLLFGAGASLAYTPSLVILGHYFSRYLGLVNGFVTAGSSVFTVVMPYALEGLLVSVQLEGCLQCLGGLMSLLMFSALLFKPAKHDPASAPAVNGHSAGEGRPSAQPRTLRHMLGRVFNVSIWHNRKYVIWALAVPVALFGYFVPYVHMVKFVEDKFKGEEGLLDGKILIMCMGLTSGLGRLIFGKIADIPNVNRILLQQISFISIGVLTMLLPLVNQYILLVAIALAMGLFDGCFISLLGPIAFEFCGQSGASQAIGFLLGLCSIPLTVGPPIAGLIYDHTKSYTLPFVLAGVPPIVGSLVLFLVWCVKKERTACDVEHGVITDSKQSIANGDCHSDSTQQPPPPPSYKDAVTTDDPMETVPLTLSKANDDESKEEVEVAETHLNGDIEADEEAEMSLLSEITKAMVLPTGSIA
ncbi:Monocarboxylate transporter 10 [Gryllus bimaculatus]|nr:Monocarboxylate transporter 10 [Gryllus bimaculatus]